MDKDHSQLQQFMEEVTSEDAVIERLKKANEEISKIDTLADITKYYKGIIQLIRDISSTVLYMDGLDLELQIPLLWNRLLETIAGYSLFLRTIPGELVEEAPLPEFYRTKRMDFMVQNNLHMCFTILGTLQTPNRQKVIEFYREEGNEAGEGLRNYLEHSKELIEYLDFIGIGCEDREF